MDYHFALRFRDAEPLYIKFTDSELAKDYMALFYRNYRKQPPMLRDQGAYDIDQMRQLADKAKHILGWDWQAEDYSDYRVTTRMHKDLETYLKSGFGNVSEHHDQLLHDLHICLHSAQLQNQRTTMQLEWFNDDGFDLTLYDFEFIHDHTLGAVLLQNPYVGHPPDWIWRQDDHSAVWQTCRFHDFVRPGLVISMQGRLARTVTGFLESEHYLAWWRLHAPDFLAHHGEKKMLANTGRPVIGYVINNADLLPLQDREKLIFEAVDFHPDLIPQISTRSLPALCEISQRDYHNIAGPDWPDYSEFASGRMRPQSVCREIQAMTGIDIKGGTP